MPNPAEAFTPAKVIDSPDRFSGRQGQLQAIADALDISGGHIVVYGNRGVGKSSLAQQMMLMSQDNADVTARLAHKPFSKMDFLPFFLQCDDSLSTIDDVFLRLVSADNGLRDWIPYRVVSREGEGSVSGTLSFKFVKIEGDSKSKFVEHQDEVVADVRTIFLNALHSIIDSGIAERGVLIVIDEFDRVNDRTGLASILKSVNDRIKFALVGVATNVSELVNEHESVSRQLTGGCVFVPPMDDEEIEDIFNRGESILEHEVTFAREARDYILQVSRGHPFLVHLICLTSAIVALRSGTKVVSKLDAQAALSEIALKGTAPIQEALYKKAVGHSHTRETILKKFADVSDEEIRTTPVYTDIASTLSIADQGIISVYMGQLASDRYGHVIERVRDRYYRFKDSLFKAYAASRPPLLSSTNADNDDD